MQWLSTATLYQNGRTFYEIHFPVSFPAAQIFAEAQSR